MTAPCSSCGVLPVFARGLCSACYQCSRRGEMPIQAVPWECRTVTMLYCPTDPALGVPMYPYPRSFQRMQFLETLAEGYWPDGCVVEYALHYRGRKTRWRVSGCYLLEVGTERVARGFFASGQHVVVQLMPEMAKGAT